MQVSAQVEELTEISKAFRPPRTPRRDSPWSLRRKQCSTLFQGQRKRVWGRRGGDGWMGLGEKEAEATSLELRWQIVFKVSS